MSLVANFFLWLWLLIALFLWRTTRGNWRARRLAVMLMVTLWLLGTRRVAEAMLWPLESRYMTPDIARLREQGVQRVVVLTGGGFPVRGEILSSAFPHASAYRFLSGLELCARLGPDCQLVFSGSAGRQNRDRATAVTMQDLAQILEPGRQVVAEARSGRTAEHPANVKPLVGDEAFILVTSATHMPRSVRTFRRAGMSPVPYPVDFLALGDYNWNDWLPSAESLWKEQVAFREYLALVLYTIRRW